MCATLVQFLEKKSSKNYTVEVAEQSLQSAVQMYSSLVYGGLPLVPKVKRELAELLAADGFTSVADAVGVDTHAGRAS